MYYYVYDEFVQDRKYEKDLFQIENRLTDLGISGKIGRLALFKDACELVKEEVRRGAKSVVLVGNDNTFNKVARVIGEVKATFGLLPLGDERMSYAEILGIPKGLLACDVLSARIVREMDVGRLNNRSFFQDILIPDTDVPIRCDGSYSIAPAEKGDIEIRNWGRINERGRELGNPTDGLFDIIIHSQIDKKTKEQTNLKHSTIDIRVKKQIPVYVDGERINGSSFKIKMAPNKTKMIVGKQRLFD